VRQVRNDHDLLRDLEGETWGYRHTPPMLAALQTDTNAVLRRLPRRARLAFAAYRRHIAALDSDAVIGEGAQARERLPVP
jgi:hypothetical protein